MHVSPLKLSLAVNVSVGKYIVIVFTLGSFLSNHQVESNIKYIYIYILSEIEFYYNII